MAGIELIDFTSWPLNALLGGIALLVWRELQKERAAHIATHERVQGILNNLISTAGRRTGARR